MYQRADDALPTTEPAARRWPGLTVVIALALLLAVTALLVGESAWSGWEPVRATDLHAISGTVTYHGQPVKRGSIRFICQVVPVENALPFTDATAPIIDGRYTVPQSEGLVPGLYLVEINVDEVYGPSETPPAVAEGNARRVIPLSGESPVILSIKRGGPKTAHFQVEDAPVPTVDAE